MNESLGWGDNIRESRTFLKNALVNSKGLSQTNGKDVSFNTVRQSLRT
jgi:hypothetical protein